MFIARYSLRLPLILVLLFLGGCGNTMVQKDTVRAHPSKPTNAPSEVPADSGITTALDLQQLTDIDALIPKLRNRRAVFVGETHDDYSHHQAQLAVIRGLHQTGGDLAIGMEMFQSPFQKYLDEYIAGDLSEGDLLRKTEWYERWVYDYRYYRPILRFARENAIPVIALNVPREIIRQVSESGLDSLKDPQRAQIPREIDYSDQLYRERLRSVFEQHAVRPGSDFDSFVQIQLLWDEGMAEQAADYLEAYPEKQMVVLAGTGHLMYGSGIPNRVKRRLADSTAILLPAGNLKVEPGIADFMLFPRSASLPPAALMGIFMEASEEGVLVSQLSTGGAAEQAGIQQGDIVISFDGTTVTSPTDLRIELMDKRPGEHVQVTVLRRGLFWGERKIGKELTLGQ